MTRSSQSDQPRFDAFEEHSFALCLTHDVDRVDKTYQSLYYGFRERDPYHFKTLLGKERPYWQFEEITSLEESFGVRSSFYFLTEKRLFRDVSPKRWLRPKNWIRYTGHYRVSEPRIADVIRRLDSGGWEVGLHGSYDSYDDAERLEQEKKELERVLGDGVLGGRQHYLRLRRPETWRHHASIGLKYDSSLGSSSDYGFEHGYGVLRPFDTDFLCFPLTVMETALVDDAESFDDARRELDRLLAEAARERAVMTVLWHPRLFNEREFPGYRGLYRHLLERAQELGAWIGPVEDAYRELVAALEARESE